MSCEITIHVLGRILCRCREDMVPPDHPCHPSWYNYISYINIIHFSAALQVLGTQRPSTQHHLRLNWNPCPSPPSPPSSYIAWPFLDLVLMIMHPATLPNYLCVVPLLSNPPPRSHITHPPSACWTSCSADTLYVSCDCPKIPKFIRHL